MDDDGESVTLGFGTFPSGVSAGTNSTTSVSITDDDVPSVTVSFGASTYGVDETDDTSTTMAKENEATVTVTLSADPERTVTIPISKANQGGATQRRLHRRAQQRHLQQWRHLQDLHVRRDG